MQPSVSVLVATSALAAARVDLCTANNNSANSNASFWRAVA